MGTLAEFTLTLLMGIALPYFLYAAFLPDRTDHEEALNSMIATASGLLGGYWITRHVSTLPGNKKSASILPSFVTSFGIVLVGILVARIDYSRALLLMGVCATIGWAFMFEVLFQARRTSLYGIVPGGRIQDFPSSSEINARVLTLQCSVEDVDAIVVDLRHDHSSAWEKRLSDYALQGVPVYHTKMLYESLSGRANLEHLSENNLGSLSPLGAYITFKRIVDPVLALVVMPLVLPVMLLIALAIRLDSPGAVFFRQRRIGYRGVPINVFKFRTMHEVNSDPASHDRDKFVTQKDDKRITRAGKLLRRCRLDELPQICNILRGEMSWIGPRPEAEKLAEWYEQELPFYRYRHVVMPGLTGWAQVNQGHVADLLDVRLKLQYDFFYIRNFSIWLDLLIVMKTVKTVLSGSGSR